MNRGTGETGSRALDWRREERLYASLFVFIKEGSR